jgi:hypothetical protein
MIDFQKLIIGEKIRGFQNGKFTQVDFNNQYLAKILSVEDKENLQFYKLESIKKLVDY